MQPLNSNYTVIQQTQTNNSGNETVIGKKKIHFLSEENETVIKVLKIAEPRSQTEDPMDILDRYCPGYKKLHGAGIANLDPFAWNRLVEEMGTIGLDLSELIELCKFMESCCRSEPYYKLKYNFDKLGFIEKIKECVTIKERLKLCNKIAAAGFWASEGLVISFKDLGFREDFLACRDINERIALYNTLAGHGSWVREGLQKNFYSLGFQEDFQACKNINERLSLCDLIENQCSYAKEDSADFFMSLGFREDFSACKDVNERLALCDLVMEHESFAKCGLKQSFLYLVVFPSSPATDNQSERLRLCNQIASHSKWATEMLAEHFSSLDLHPRNKYFLRLNDQIKMLSELAAQGEWAARGIIKEFRFLFPEDATDTDRIKLIGIIASQLSPEDESLCDGFYNLGLTFQIDNCQNLRQRYELCMQIANMHQGLAMGLTSRSISGLLEFNPPEFFAICQYITSWGVKASRKLASSAMFKNCFNVVDSSELIHFLRKILTNRDVQIATSLANNIQSLKVEDASLSEGLALCRTIALQNKNKIIAMVKDLDRSKVIPPSIKGRYILELLVPPIYTHPQNEIGPSYVKQSRFPQSLKPLVSFLLIEEENLTEFDFLSVENAIIQNTKLSFLAPLYDKSNKSGNGRAQLARWIAYTAAVLYYLEEEQVQEIEKSGILDNIFSYRNPTNRFALVRELSLIPHQILGTMPKDPITNNEKVSTEAKQVKWSRLAWVLIQRLREIGIPEESANEIFDLITHQSKFRDTVRFNQLVQLLLSIMEAGPYSLEEANEIADAVIQCLRKKNSRKAKKGENSQLKVIDMISKDLKSLTAVVDIFGKEEFLKCLKSKVNYESYFQTKFCSLFDVGEMEDFSCYHETFGSFRDRLAIFTYLRSVLSLGSGETEKVYAALNAYVRSVLEGTFHQLRYDETKSAHLNVVFGYGNGLKEVWIDKGNEVRVTSSKEPESTSQKFYKDFFKQKIFVDMHLNPQLFPLLLNYLDNQINTSKVESAAHDPLVAFQILAIDLCEGNISSVEFVERVLDLKLELGEFHNDLKALTSQKSSGAYILSESDEPCDLLMIGTEVNGSCQRVDGSPNLNKCLAAYLMNGEIIPIIVKREGQPEIVARAMLRLMWDTQNQKPVLLLERVYSNVGSDAITKAIISRAEQKAQKMGVTLVSKEVGQGELFEGSVEFLGGYAPFTYSDASHGTKLGAFTVENCHVLYSPNEMSIVATGKQVFP